jgi:TFIIF-interacting CTD phosphatase-like protein
MDEVLSFTFTPDEEGYLTAPRRKHDFHLWFEDYECLLNIYKRKNLDNFLSYLSEECEPVIFSTGVKSYVELVMGLIDPTRKIKHIFTQEHCDHIEDEEAEID